MYYSFKKYSIKEISENTVIEGIRFNAYVEISLNDAYDNQICTFQKGLINPSQLQEQLKKDETLALKHCYLKDFDIAHIYNDSLEDPKKKQFKVKELSIEDCVFESNSNINFSNIKLTQKEFSFKNNYILKGKLDFHRSTLGREVNDFTHNIFYSGSVDFSNCNWGKQLNSFKNSVFKEGFKNFQFSHFNSGELNFTNVDFGLGDASFINAQFEADKVTFKVATFEKGKVDFHYARFNSKLISFERVDFGEGQVDFSKVEFGSAKVNFNRSSFTKGEINFEGIELRDNKLTFKKVKFHDNLVSFNDANCTNASLLFQSAYLGDSSFKFKELRAHSVSFKGCHFNKHVDFRVRQVNYIDLSATIVRDLIDFSFSDGPVKIDQLNLQNMRLIGKLFIDWNKNKVKQLISLQKNASQDQKAYQYRLLKQNFHDIGDYESEDKAYIMFKRAESISKRETILQCKLKNKGPFKRITLLWEKAWAYPIYYFKDLLLNKAGLYATSPIRVLWSMFVTYILYSGLYLLSNWANWGQISGSKANDLYAEITDCFYFSIITFLTVGYGDFVPEGLNRWIAGIEAFSGVFLMSYFTVSFVRKILR